jgi:hypothetical protein
MKGSRRVVHSVVSAIVVTAVSWLLAGCGDSSPLGPTAPQVALRSPAVAAVASRTEFDGFDNNCFSADPTQFNATPGGTVHFRVSNDNRWVTGNPLIDGVERNTGVANINNSGRGVVHLDSSLKPDAVNGTWEIQTHLSLPDFVGSGVGRGTGDLQGMTIKFTFDLAAGPSDCNPNGPKGHVHGVILSSEQT